MTESPELEADRERSRRSYNAVLMSLLWRGVVRASFEALERHGPERVRIQRFEQLAASPEAEVRELCAWLGLEFEPALLEIPVVNSSYATTGAGVSSEPVERWRERLSPAEVGIVQSVCEPLLSRARLRAGRRERLAAPARVGVGNGSVRGGSRRGRQPAAARQGDAVPPHARRDARSRAGRSSRRGPPRRPTRPRASGCPATRADRCRRTPGGGRRRGRTRRARAPASRRPRPSGGRG